MDIYDLNVKIRKYCIKSCPLTVIENLTLFFNDTWNLNFKQNNIDFINFYNKIFNPTSSYIENKKNFASRLKNKEDGYIFFKK